MKLLGLSIFSISKTRKQVIWELSLDFGSLERINKFSYLVKSKRALLLLMFLLSRDRFAFPHHDR